MKASIAGGYDRELLQAFLNILLTRGVLKEVRILKIGEESYLQHAINIMKLAHDFDEIYLVDFENLIVKDGEGTDILVFLNSSLDSTDNFLKVSIPLVQLVLEVIQRSAIEDLKIIFGDNNRGLLQHSYLQNLLDKSKPAETKPGLEIVAVSSAHHISKTFNSTMGEGNLRVYPKADGEIFTYDPSGEMEDGEAAAVVNELQDKLKIMEDVFSADNTSSAYPYIEGRTLAKFIEVYAMNQNWEQTKMDDGLCSRVPSQDEKDHYGLDASWPLFLPAIGNRLPTPVFTHMKQVSAMIEEKMKLLKK